MRRAARRDDNEPAIITALRAVGAVVQQQQPPQPDLLVSHRGQLEQIEVKDLKRDARATPHRGKGNKLDGRMAWLTSAQVGWWTAWLAAGGRPPIIVLDSIEALAAIGVVVAGTDPAHVCRSIELPADLVPDATAVHLQRKPRC